MKSLPPNRCVDAALVEAEWALNLGLNARDALLRVAAILNRSSHLERRDR